MAAGTTNPLRQQMINMMYLVLTALLALNVSADILKAFAIVNGGLEGTNNSYKAKNLLTMEQFKQLYEIDKAKAQKVFDNAKIAVQKSDEMYNYLQEIKEDMAKKAGGWKDEEKKSVENDQDLEVATHMFLKEKNGIHGKELRDRLTKYQAEMKGLLIDQKGNPHPDAVSFKIDTNDPPKSKDGDKKNWQEYYFEGVPVIAAITEVTKFQNDVRNAESEVNKYLISQVGATDQKFDNILAIVSSETPAVFQGNEYSAKIFLGAYSSTQDFEAYVGNTRVPVVNGVAEYKVRGEGIGTKELPVKIRYKSATGEMEERTTKTEYQVFTGSATIAADKMNMLYIGLENPMSVSVPGFSDAQTIVSWGGLPSKKVGPGKYIVEPTPTTPRLVTVSVSAKMPDGGTKAMGKQEYRIRNVPKPEVLFGSKTGGAISRGELLTVNNVFAGLGESFAFEGLNYKVTKYTFVYAPKAGQAYFEPVTGNALTGSIKSKIAAARPGDMIIITEVTAMGPGGLKQLNGPSLTVK